MKRLIIAVMLITILLFAACSSGSAAKPFTIKMTGATTSPAYTPPATQYTPPTSSYVPPPATTNEPVTLTNVSYAITEQNEIWWRYAWKFTVNNPGSWPINSMPRYNTLTLTALRWTRDMNMDYPLPQILARISRALI